MRDPILRRFQVVPPRLDDFSWLLIRLRLASRFLRYGLGQLKSLGFSRPSPAFRLRHPGFTRHDFVLYGLDERPATDFVSTYMQCVPATRFNGSYDHAVNNKVLFPHLMRAAGLPHPRYFGRLGPAGFQSAEGGIATDRAEEIGKILRTVPRLAIKPIKGSKGAGLLFLDRDGEPIRANGVPILGEELEVLLRRLGPAIVTEFIDQHEYARVLFPTTTNTIRLLTLWDYAAGRPFIAAAAQRIGSSRSHPADNFRGGRGGLSAEIDRSTGMLSRAATLSDSNRVEWFETHPESDAPIAGIQVPHWPETIRSVLEGARILSFAPCVAWDVVITNEGFNVVEINGAPGLHVHQVHRPLLADPRNRAFYRHFGVVR